MKLLRQENEKSSLDYNCSCCTQRRSICFKYRYYVPLKKNAGDSVEGKVSSDVDLDVTMTSPGAYSATISYGLEGGARTGNGATDSKGI